MAERSWALCSPPCCFGISPDLRPGKEATMTLTLKKISKSGISEAFQKVELYRYLNEPEEAESICRDILEIEPGNQLALRLLGLTITDQFIGARTDRYAEVQAAFQTLKDPYERFYYMG